uniref:Uncharacterized protein n=1 Tax=Ditylenchus dipsaci TaxID=166011 RepID=A0A915DAX9_9BILA
MDCASSNILPIQPAPAKDAVMLTHQIEIRLMAERSRPPLLVEKMMNGEGKYKAMMQKESFLKGGQNFDFCMANTSQAHPASNMVDGSPAWHQRPHYLEECSTERSTLPSTWSRSFMWLMSGSKWLIVLDQALGY